MSFIGSGSYGQVYVRDGKAVKKFGRLTHLIQEYSALVYLRDCKYTVHPLGVNFPQLEMEMELYDGSLRHWITEHWSKGKSIPIESIKIVVRDILRGLIELHDRGLAHGDIKPGNILIKREPFRCVLGDCGFVSVTKYAKIQRTAPAYRDPVIGKDQSHDMFSLGIIILELITGSRLEKEFDYRSLEKIIDNKVSDKEFWKIIHNLTNRDRKRRPSARTLLKFMFNEEPTQWHSIFQENNDIDISGVERENRTHLRAIMKDKGYSYEIHRAKKGHGALISHFSRYKVEQAYYETYACAALTIVSALFGRSIPVEIEVNRLIPNKGTDERFYEAVNNLIKDDLFLNIILFDD